MKKNNKKIVLVLGIVGLLILLTGVTFALMSGNLLGVRENIISLNSNVSFIYEESSNALALDLDSILDDNSGKAQDDYFDFTVSLLSKESMTTNYLIYITEDVENSTIANSGVKIYLTDQDNNSIVEPTSIGSLDVHNSYANSYKLYQTSITGSDNVRTIDEYRIRVWIDSGYGLSINEENGVHEVTIDDATYKFKVNVEVFGENLNKSGANAPELATGMIPVYYDATATCSDGTGCWKKADQYNANEEYRWYSYASSGETKGMWANAVTVDVLTASVKDKYFNSDMSIKVTDGTEISMADINTMWVWIPRFNAVTPSNYNDGTALAPGAINVTFVDNNTPSIDAFWRDEDSDGVQEDGEQKSGFWYGKFETSSDKACVPQDDLGTNSNCNSTTIKPKIIPNVISWRGAQVSTFFNAARNMEIVNNMYGLVASEVDTHMSKNNEWGAVAYLAQSIYGRCSDSATCDEVTINNCKTYTTGIGGDTVSAEASSTTCTTAANQYNGIKGVLASTTGTVYGVYDMSGGSWEYVMGNYNKVSGYKTENYAHSGFNGNMYLSSALTTGIPFPDSKYVNIYTGMGNGSDTYYGHALNETMGWYSDYEDFIYTGYPWFIRGGYWNNTYYVGVFAFIKAVGNSKIVNGCRFAMIKQ